MSRKLHLSHPPHNNHIVSLCVLQKKESTSCVVIWKSIKRAIAHWKYFFFQTKNVIIFIFVYQIGCWCDCLWIWFTFAPAVHYVGKQFLVYGPSISYILYNRKKNSPKLRVVPALVGSHKPVTRPICIVANLFIFGGIFIE